MHRRERLFAATLLILLPFRAPVRAATVGFRPPVDYPAGTKPRGIVVADFNGDGKMDLAVGDYGDPNTGDDGGVKLFLGNGDGTFQSATNTVVGKNPCLNPTCLVSADFNGDGRADLAVANNDSSLSVLFGRGDGTFQTHVDYVTGGRPSDLLLGDLNGDHHPDLIMMVFNFSVSTRLGNRDGTFQNEVVHSTAFPPTGVTVFDVNSDGKPDMIITEGRHGIETLLGNGDGTFQPGISCTCGATVAMFNPTNGADFNEDGHMDLAVMLFDDHFQNHNQVLSAEKVLLGNGDGTFTPANTPLSSSRPADFVGAVTDLSRDGHADLAITLDPLVALFGDGSGIFKTATFASGRAGTSIAAADINGDNFPDVIVTGLGTISVLLNTKQPVAVLRLSLAGNGSGTVTSSPPGISCSGNMATCSPPFNSGSFNIGTTVSLTAASALDEFTFAGWTGACSGTGACDITMNSDKSVTATFSFPDFSVSADTATPASVTAGHSATSTISVTSVGGFHDAVQFQCSVDPVSTLAPACSFTPPSATPAANGSISSTLTVSTTAPTTAFVGPIGHGWVYAIWLPIAGLAWLGIGCFSKPPRNKKLAASLLCSLLIAEVVFQASCGGQTSPEVHQIRGTPPGAYTITVMGTSGSTQHSTTVTLMVQ